MTRRRQFVLLLLAGVLLLEVGCEKKKPQLPRQAKAPAELIAMPLPAEISEETQASPAPPPPTETAKADDNKPQPAKHRKRKPAQNPATQGAANAQASSPNGSLAVAHPPVNPATEPPPDTAIAADVTSAQLIQQKQTTAQLLDSTEKTLGGLHSLSHDEEQMVVQIRSYVAQSRKATTEGDFERAYNLATKAHLLCDALVKK